MTVLNGVWKSFGALLTENAPDVDWLTLHAERDAAVARAVQLVKRVLLTDWYNDGESDATEADLRAFLAQHATPAPRWCPTCGHSPHQGTCDVMLDARRPCACGSLGRVEVPVASGVATPAPVREAPPPQEQREVLGRLNAAYDAGLARAEEIARGMATVRCDLHQIACLEVTEAIHSERLSTEPETPATKDGKP